MFGAILQRCMVRIALLLLLGFIYAARTDYDCIDEHYIGSLNVSEQLIHYGRTGAEMSPSAWGILERGYSIAQNPPACDRFHIVDFDYEYWTLKVNEPNVCPPECTIEWTGEHRTPASTEPDTRTFHPLENERVFTPEELYYDPEHWPGSWYLFVRCACTDKDGNKFVPSSIPQAMQSHKPGASLASVVKATFQGIHAPDTATAPEESEHEALGGLKHFAVLQLDAVSRTFLHYFGEKLYSHMNSDDRPYQATEMGNYNVVDQNTRGNMSPFWSGRVMDDDFPPTTFHTPKFWDDPTVGPKISDKFLIYDLFREAGFITADAHEFCESVTGSLTGHTDKFHHHFNYVYRDEVCDFTAHINGLNAPRVCRGGLPTSRDMTRWTSDLFEAHGDDKVALWIGTSESHCSDPYCTGWELDLVSDVVAMLMEQRNDTMMVLMSDHGNHYGEMFQTDVGFIAHKQPFCIILVPKWWASKYPDAMHNLRENRHNQMTTYDLYYTMRHLLENFPEESNRERITKNMKLQSTKQSPQSLFERLSIADDRPFARTCQEAGIPIEYCILSPSSYTATESQLCDPVVLKILDKSIEQANKNARAHLTSKYQPTNCVEIVRTSKCARMVQVLELDGQYNYHVLFDTNLETSFSMGVRVDKNGKIKYFGRSYQVSSTARFEQCRDKGASSQFCLCYPDSEFRRREAVRVRQQIIEEERAKQQAIDAAVEDLCPAATLSALSPLTKLSLLTLFVLALTVPLALWKNWGKVQRLGTHVQASLTMARSSQLPSY
ncbi:Protein of unknown function DUF229 [Carpediemonas membranifera]|uniref:Sulfatase N-terminal domain-containing protein n=1 Tax=Carpediemonas membranifera TaxID=201153 RepID=A0A8J6AZ34_9EUKA|nr:Protein of unknown function DUF229 [Carpediemonas membranifera]|eukprot:KAG9389474.1 Protein of unknown function DUF229 [Carpediemonas membranifera]